MKIELITEEPLWLIVFCILLGAAFSYFLYSRDKMLEETSVILRRGLAFLRFLAVTIISFLLLAPLVRSLFQEVEKPIVIIAQDNSQSLVHGKDSAYYFNTYPEQLRQLSKKLEEKFDVRTFSFGDKVKDGLNHDFNDKQTSFSELFDDMISRFSNRNVGAMIVASDGLFNHGTNPLYASGQFKVPVYAVAMGDTNVHKDLILSSIRFNPRAYIGNNFPLEITVNARKCAGERTRLTVSWEDKDLVDREIDIRNNAFQLTVPLFFEARKKGIQKYSVRLSSVSGEINTGNNSRDVFIDVLEGMQKILILANAPHPDLSAMRNSLEINQSYDVALQMAEKWDGKLSGYDLVVLHQLPSKIRSMPALFSALRNATMPVLYILGDQLSLSEFNRVQEGLKITESRNLSNEVTASISESFSVFSLSERLITSLPKYPPLTSPFGTYRAGGENQVLCYQQMGQVKTNMPLIMFTMDGQSRMGVIAGEGIWRWRLRNYAESQDHELVNELLLKTVQYLTVKEDKSRFRINTRNSFRENEPVLFNAELYNKSYEMVNIPELNITIMNSDRKSFPFVFSRTEKAYTLNAGMFPPGEYTYSASLKLGDEAMQTSGRFTVSPLQLENSETVADHQVLYAMATQNGGEMFMPDDLSSLADRILSRNDIKPVTYERNQLKEVISLAWVFFTILLLISVEWFLRKRNGAY